MRSISLIFFILVGIQPAFAGDVGVKVCKDINYLTNALESLLQSLDIYSPPVISG